MSNSRHTEISHPRLQSFFSEFDEVLGNWRKSQAAEAQSQAQDFNVFDFIAPSENVLSDILAFLLNPKGSHGQGPLFLEILFSRSCPGMVFELERADIAREALTYSIKKNRRRLDIRVSLPNFVLAIETKKFTGEGNNQISDYADHLGNVSSDRFCLIFLTRTGDDAVSIDPARSKELQRNGKLNLWSWETDIPTWLDGCRNRCRAPKIQHFLEDFKSYIAAYLAVNPPEVTYEQK